VVELEIIKAVPPCERVVRQLGSFLDPEGIRTHQRLHTQYAHRFNSILGGIPSGIEPEDLPPDVYDRLLWNENGCELHNIWWGNLSYKPSSGPGSLPQMSAFCIRTGKTAYTALEVVDEMKAVGHMIHGSGWVALSYSGAGNVLTVHEIKNHSYPWSELVPLVLVDVWEHSYVGSLVDRGDYIERVFSLVDWSVINRRIRGE